MVWFACVYICCLCVTRRWVMWCAVMVGVYVHALAFVDVRAIFMWCACCVCVHVRCMCDDASGVWLAFVGGRWARV